MGEISNRSLISDLTAKIGDEALFILRNRADSLVAENWAALADNWAHERRVHFRYYSGENSVEKSMALNV